MATLQKTDTLAVVGAGAMGAGIAQVMAAAGHPVRLFDAKEGMAQHAAAEIGKRFEKLADKGKITFQAASEAAARIVPVNTLDALSDCALVLEAIVEDLAIKQSVFKTLESVVADTCILASNTSSISITAIASVLRRPERLAGLHFFNPAPLMALVEIVSGLATSPEIAQTLYHTAQAWGKTPVYARSTPGFIVNRIARPFYAEAMRLREEQAADCAMIDACLREAGAFRMGAFELTDLIGQDVNYAVTSSVWQAFYHDPRFLPSLLQKELVDAGRLGRKSGRGFYDYQAGIAPQQAQNETEYKITEAVRIFGDSAAATALADRLTAAKQDFLRKEAHDDERIATIGDAVLYVTDGQSASERALANDTDNTVLIDLAADYATAKRLAVSAAFRCREDSRQQAFALLQAAGFAVSEIQDMPALVVMRTVAMLVNEAADAVYHGVCSAADADLAMKLGVNYPQGPLAWANRVGIEVIYKALSHLAQFYGEDRYRISPLLRRLYLNKEVFDV